MMTKHYGAETIAEARKLLVSLRRVLRKSKHVKQACSDSARTELFIFLHATVNLVVFLMARPVTAAVVGAPSASELARTPQVFTLGAAMAAACIAIHGIKTDAYRWVTLACVAVACGWFAGFVFVGFSIIALVWGGIITAPAVCVAATRPYVLALVARAEGATVNGGQSNLAESVQSALHFVAARTVESLLAIAAIGGVCGSILFRGGWDDVETKINAAWMAIGLGLLSLMCLVWILVPIRKGLIALYAKNDRVS